MDIRLSLKESGIAAIVALILFVPIIGMVLDGQTLTFKMTRTFVLVALVFAGRLLIAYLRSGHVGDRVGEVFQPVYAGWAKIRERIEGRLVAFNVALVLMLLIMPFMPFSTNYLIQIVTLTFVYIMLGTGLNIVVGLAGMLDLGYVAFYATGAYGYALLAQYFGLSFWFALPVMAGIAALVGGMLGFPVLRMHGDYLAIVTLGFGEIIRILLVNLTEYTGGPNGISAPRPTLFGLAFQKKAEEGQATFHEFFDLPYDSSYRYIFIYVIAIFVMVLAIYVFKRLREMPIGRAWEALREDEVACKALGINHTTTKLSAFALGAMFGGLGGVFFAAMEGFINPSSFQFIESAIILAIVVLGGMGSILGVIIAAVGITLLPELFRELEAYRMLMFGLAMVFIMIWRPGGLLKVRRKSFTSEAHGNK